MTTLRAFRIDIGKIHASGVKVRGFAGTQRGFIKQINLPLLIGDAEFHVLDIFVSYNNPYNIYIIANNSKNIIQEIPIQHHINPINRNIRYTSI